MNSDLFLLTLSGLENMQLKSNTEYGITGEFAHTLTTLNSTFVDYNFLTGYTLYHLSSIVKLLNEKLPTDSGKRISQILERASPAIDQYQTTQGSFNWYRQNRDGLHIPGHFSAWADAILSLKDDLDDTAIAIIQWANNPLLIHQKNPPVELFTDNLYDPVNHKINDKSLMRLQYADIERDVFMAWILNKPDTKAEQLSKSVIWLPNVNSIELITAVNIWTALYSSFKTTSFPGALNTKLFINNLFCSALKRCIAQHSSWPLEFCAPYYPRAICTSISFLLRNHVLTDYNLLTNETLSCISDILHQPELAILNRNSFYVGTMYWLNCMGWAKFLKLTDDHFITTKVIHVLNRTCIEHMNTDEKRWRDFTFFLSSHIGDYSGVAYTSSLAAETLAFILFT